MDDSEIKICPCCGRELFRPGTIGDAAEKAIEYYYRARAAQTKAWRKLTLRRIAQERGLSYSTLTKCKMAYDAAGKWGSRDHA